MANADTQKKTSYFSILVRVGIAAAACWLIFDSVDIAELAQVFKRLSISSFVFSLIVFLLGLCLIGFRWWIFMRAQKIYIALSMAVKLTFLGQFFTNFMPSAVGGDLVRAWYVSRHTDKKLQAALGVGADRIVGLISTFVLAIASYLIFMRGNVEIFHAIRSESRGIIEFLDAIDLSAAQIMLIVIFLLGVMFILSGIFDLTRFFKVFYGHIIHFLNHAKEVISVYVKYPLILLSGLCITIALQSLMIVALWRIGVSLDIKTPLFFYFVFFPMMWVIGSLPLSIAGIGILEGGLVLLFVQFTGAEQEAATALALCQRFIWILASVPGMAVHLTGSHRVQ